MLITDKDIQLLAEICCEYNCFDIYDRHYYDVLKKAIKAFRVLQNVPESHGDLIDRSLLCADICAAILSHEGTSITELDEILRRQKAVIEAEV